MHRRSTASARGSRKSSPTNRPNCSILGTPITAPVTREYEEETREIIPAFIDKSPKLSWLRDDPRTVAVAKGLLGDGYVYAESDGNLFNCDVYWHLDAYGAVEGVEHIKLSFYLDELHHDTGALRVIPGSHFESTYAKKLHRGIAHEPARVRENLGTRGRRDPFVDPRCHPGRPHRGQLPHGARELQRSPPPASLHRELLGGPRSTQPAREARQRTRRPRSRPPGDELRSSAGRAAPSRRSRSSRRRTGTLRTRRSSGVSFGSATRHGPSWTAHLR